MALCISRYRCSCLVTQDFFLLALGWGTTNCTKWKGTLPRQSASNKSEKKERSSQKTPSRGSPTCQTSGLSRASRLILFKKWAKLPIMIYKLASATIFHPTKLLSMALPVTIITTDLRSWTHRSLIISSLGTWPHNFGIRITLCMMLWNSPGRFQHPVQKGISTCAYEFEKTVNFHPTIFLSPCQNYLQ